MRVSDRTSEAEFLIRIGISQKHEKSKKHFPVPPAAPFFSVKFGKVEKYFINHVPVHNFDKRPVRKAAVTLSREEAAQARRLIVRRILNIWER